MRTKKLLAIMLAALFMAGLLPLGGISLPAAKAETTVDWPQITGFSVTDGFVYDKPSKATVKAAVKDCTITQYDQKESCGVSGFDIVGEICLTVSEPVLCSDGSKTDLPDQLIVTYGNWSIDSVKDADIDKINKANPSLRYITTQNQGKGVYTEVVRASDFNVIYIYSGGYLYYRLKIVVDAEIIDPTDPTEPDEPTWPHLTGYDNTQPAYFYNSSIEANRTLACRINNVEVVNYASLTEKNGYMGTYYVAGELNVTTDAPVEYANGQLTSVNVPVTRMLSISTADFRAIASESDVTFGPQNGIQVSRDGGNVNRLTSSSSVDDWFCLTKDGTRYVYKVTVTVEEPNTAPALKEGVTSPAAAETEAGKLWSIDLSTIFEDADGDALSYTVSVNGAEAAATGGLFSMLPAVAGETTLVFTASDGKATSPEYTLTLTAKASGGTTPAVSWPLITGFSVTDGFVYDKEIDPTIKAAVVGCTITQYEQKVSCGVYGYDIVGEICLNVSEPVLCSDGSKADMPDQFVVRYGNWTIDSIKNADANEIDAAKPAIRNITTDKQENGEYSEVVREHDFNAIYISDDEWEQYCYYRFKIVVDAEPTEPEWPQLTGFQLADAPYIYNDYVAKSRNTAWEIKDITVDNYAEIEMREDRGDRPYAGEIQITVKAPVTVENGAATSTPATELPTEIWIKKGTFSGTVTNGGTIAGNNHLRLVPDDSGAYKTAAYATEVTINYGDNKIVYYSVSMTVVTEPTWPQLTGFSENDGYFYNGTTKRKKTIACKITDMDIINYDSLESVTLDSIDVDIAGEIAFKIDSPVKYDSTAGVTTEPDVYPARLLIPDETYSITATKDVTLDTTIVIAAETVSGSDVNLPTYKTASYYDLLRYTYEGKTYYYYLTITPNAATSTAPRIRDGIDNPMKVQLEVGNVFTIDLDNVFVDDNGSTLTYTVSVNGADAAATGSKYTFTPDKDGATDLVFKASNGQESEPFVVNIATSAVKYYAVSASAEGEYTVNSYKQSMGTAEVTVHGAKANEAKPGDKVTVTAVTQPCVLQSLLYDAKVDHWEATGVDLGADINGQSVTFTMPENEVTLKAVLTKKGSVVEITANDFTGGELMFNVGSMSPSDNGTYENGAHVRDVMTDTFPEGVKVSIRVWSKYNEGYKIDRWEIINTTTGQPVENVEYTNTQYPSSTGKYDYPTFTVDGVSNYSVKAIFAAKDYANVNVVADAAQGTATAQAGANTGSTLAGVFEGTTVKLTAAANENYAIEKWEASYIAADGSTVAIEITNADKTEASFVMPATNRAAVTVKATFKKIKLSAECVMTEEPELLDANGKAIGVVSQSGMAYTITLPAGTDVSKLSEMKLKLSYSDFASVRKNGGEAVDWSVGIACGMKIDIPAKFTVVAEDGENTKDYTITIVLAKNGNNAITKVELLATADKAVIAEGTLEGDTWTITVTDKNVADNLTMQYLRLTYDEKATVAMAGGYGDATGDFKWRNGDVMCGMSVNQPVKFTVTAENGDTKEYTIVVKYDAPAAPELTNGSAERTSDKEATVKFTSGEAGTYYYAVVNKGATTPTVDTTKNGKNAVAGENVITLNNLTAGAREIYIIVKNAGGVESAALKVDIPAFGGGTEQPGEFKITISAPKGGTLTASKTTAGAGDTITVTATPDAGMQLVAGSLTYTLAVAGGETKRIDNFTFTMPAGDVSLTCKWETKSTTVDGITGFSINGVSGSINQTNGTISVVMPYGTDVSKLVPVISGNNITDMTPGSGVMQNFSKPVTYTVTLADGTTKTYTVTVYVQSGTAADQMWGKLTDFYNQVPWWKYAEHQQSYGKYPRYW